MHPPEALLPPKPYLGVIPLLGSHNAAFLCSRGKLYTPPPPPPFLAKRHFPVEGGGGVYFEAPRGRNFIPPPFIHPPPLEGYFQGWGGGGV